MKNEVLRTMIALNLTLLMSMAVPAAPKPRLSWNFDDGSTEGLTVLSGQWSVVSQQLYVLPGSLSFS